MVMNHWETFWNKTKNSPLLENPLPIMYGGTNIEPLATIGMTAFLDAIKDKFNEGFSIIDYGCGAGILINPISERLDSFTYYGLEPVTGDGPNRINLGKTHFNDSRVNFGFIETDFNNIIENKIDTIILISIFTHLTIEDISNTLDNLIKVFEKNPECTIVFSCFTDSIRRLVRHQPEIWERFYNESYILIDDLINYSKNNNLKLTKHSDFFALNNYKHEIFKLEKL
jgi:2-polyprenyl-3-methyl-5-hydroxy-6-metoxy-1,4-benzoquinol methylase